MPAKTSDSILKHVERLRSTRRLQKKYQTDRFRPVRKVASPPAKSTPPSRPASRVPSTMSTIQSTSCASRTERSVQAHIERISRSRSGSPSATVVSLKVTPVQPLSAKSRSLSNGMVAPATAMGWANDLDLRVLDHKLEKLSVAPLKVVVVVRTKEVSARKSTTEEALARKSCLCPIVFQAKSKKKVLIPEYGGYNVHRVRPFDRNSAPNEVLTHSEFHIKQPTWFNPRDEVEYASVYLPHPAGDDRELRWPPPLHNGPLLPGARCPASYCRDCFRKTRLGVQGIRYRSQQASHWCKSCTEDREKFMTWFNPVLDYDGEEDHKDNYPINKKGRHPKRDCYYVNVGELRDRILFRRQYFDDDTLEEEILTRLPSDSCGV